MLILYLAIQVAMVVGILNSKFHAWACLVNDKPVGIFHVSLLFLFLFFYGVDIVSVFFLLVHSFVTALLFFQPF